MVFYIWPSNLDFITESWKVMGFFGTRKWRIIFPSKKDKSVKDNHQASPQWFYFQVFMFLFYLLSPLYQNWFPWVRDTGTNDDMWLLRLSPKRHCDLLELSSWLVWASIWKGNQSMHKKSPLGSCRQLIRNGNKQPTPMLVSHLGKRAFFSFIQTIRQLQHWLIV